MNIKGFTTKILHTAFSKPDVHGARHIPIYSTASYSFESAEDIADAFQGKKLAHAYSRSGNPTVEHLEQRVKSITGALSVLALSSGMAAINTLLLTLLKSGDNVITTPNLFGNSYSLFDSTLANFGVNFKFANVCKPLEIEQLIDTNTRLIFLETISNPQMEVANLKAIATIARKHNVLLVVDSTLTPPCIFNAKENGVDIEIISSTKHISGGGTTVGGLILDYGTYNWENNPRVAPLVKQHQAMAFTIKLRREVFRNTGACLSPFNAYLQVLGLETLALRVERSCNNALELAQWLQKQKGIKLVSYPGLQNSAYYTIAKQQFCGAPGSLMAFDMESEQACMQFMNKLQIINRATNLSDNRSLIIHPASTIYSEYNAETLMLQGIRDTLIRFSVGIEDIDDLKNDILQAL